FDLPRGITIIGRSLDCHLTIEDPLVSRQHARIVIDDSGAYVEDMASRNGVRVDGSLIKGPTTLSDGVRLRIGTQDFLFCNVDIPGKAHSKTTGVLRLCANCRMPYPREAPSCPNCEATEQTDEDTLTGVGPSEGGHSTRTWSAQLLVEALDRALALARLQDAERILRRATAQIEEMVASGGQVDFASLGALASRAAATTFATDDPTWALWVLDIYRRIGAVPPAEFVERLADVPTRHRPLVLGAVTSLLAHLGARAGLPSQRSMEALTRLEQVKGLLSEGTTEESGVSSSSWHRSR
ncbi:MAG: FHA domain-containing protein, partial [Polyangiaceae bacterium]